jgi:hypothetical protein
MPENRKPWTIIVLVLIVVAVMAATFGGLYAWDKAKTDKENTAANKTAKTADTNAKDEEEKPVAMPDGSYKGWQIYDNAAAGYSLKYPAEWTYTAEKATASGAAADFVTFNNDDKDYAFSFGLRKPGSPILIDRGTAVGAGTAESGGTVEILGQSIPKTYYVENGRVSIIFYGSGLGGSFPVGGVEIAAELRIPGYDNKTLKGSPQEAIADMIVSSLALK